MFTRQCRIITLCKKRNVVRKPFRLNYFTPPFEIRTRLDFRPANFPVCDKSRISIANFHFILFSVSGALPLFAMYHVILWKINCEFPSPLNGRATRRAGEKTSTFKLERKNAEKRAHRYYRRQKYVLNIFYRTSFRNKSSFIYSCTHFLYICFRV